MSWVESMELDAVAIAAPDFELRDTDVIEFDCQWEVGAFAGSEVTGPDPDEFMFEVTVKRDGQAVLDVLFVNDDAARFFTMLMQKGSGQ